MLGARTKQIYAYGKRNQRIVNVSENGERKPVPNIFDDMEPVPRAPIASKMRKREHTAGHTKSKTPSPKIVHMHRKKRLSPLLSPPKRHIRVTQLIGAEAHRTELPSPLPKTKALASKKSDNSTPSRAPLAHFSLNVPGSPAFPTKVRGAKVPGAKGTPPKLNKPFSPFVDVDIIVLDDDGRTVRKERRISRADIEANPANRPVPKPPKPTASQRKPSVHLGSEVADNEESFELRKQPKRPARRVALTVYSDESESEDEAPPPPRRSSSKAPANPQPLPPPRPEAGPSRSVVEVIIPPALYSIKTPHAVAERPPPPAFAPPLRPAAPLTQYHNLSPPVARTRPLTPIRRHGGRNLFNPPSPPSPSMSTDLDLSLDFEELTISASSHLDASCLHVPEIPEYLKPLLAECGQESCGPIEFSSFIETFPYDPAVRSDGAQPVEFRKIGEASYSEVFGIGDVVLKVIPLRDESAGNASAGQIKTNVRRNEGAQEEEDGPPPSDAKDVLKEIIVTHAMGEVCDGFVKLLKAYVVRGKYPEVLLRLWDEYNSNKGSESVRPDKFHLSQVYAIIVLPNGGPDLEAYRFTNASKMGWRQACSLFWQVAKTLAHAEQLVSFEHRDLHLGQILVKDLPMPETLPLRARNQNSKSKSGSSRVYMDDPIHGVRATLIDLGLSRMDAGDGHGGEMVHWTAFEDEIFMGEGDYQFDVYRMMREHNGGAWEEFRPLTNVMWLHYLAVKLLKSKRLKPPSAPRSPPTLDTAAFTEKDCYDCLVDIERWLHGCVAALAPAPKPSKTKGRRKTQAPLPLKPSAPFGPACAGEIVVYAVKKGWIQTIT
ncbi:putative protein with domain of unknown function [Lyophyllum shimeji]|uniref:non-specific serine/threonine protein kinase n=1 Tax=Lyophyllum shimeji TaxID=47721 RepID=A0A9P3PDS9_LYOSH|nr:putative protein with domain of unknown function [Lyophyllum shimeji]